ncbi:MAG: hypothetical protein DRI73_02420, partial [Bacteroidetes bacterium]
VPAYIGITADTDNGDVNESINFLKEIGTFVFPNAIVAYQFPIGPVKTGIGLKAYSLIIESVLWPVIYAELDLSPIVINANLGGLGFYWFGIIPDLGFKTSNVIIPDLNIAVKLGKSFRLGIGAMAFPGIKGLENITPYTIYLTGRFSILFDKDK